MKKIVGLLVCLFCFSVASHAQTVISQTDYADDGKVHILNPTGSTAAFTLTWPDTSQCTGTLAPSAETTCDSNGNYAILTDGFTGWIWFTGHAFYGRFIGYGDQRDAWLNIAMAITNFQSSGMYASVQVYSQDGQTLLCSWSDTIAANAVFAVFMNELFPGLSWPTHGTGYYQVHVATGAPSAVMWAECISGECTQQL